MNRNPSHAMRRLVVSVCSVLFIVALVVAGLKTERRLADAKENAPNTTTPLTNRETAAAAAPSGASSKVAVATSNVVPSPAPIRRIIRDQQASTAVSPPVLPLIAQGSSGAVATTTPGTPAGSAPAGKARTSSSPKAPVVIKSPAAMKKAPAPPFPAFVSPTPEQIRDQPASVTAAQVLTQRLNLDDPATRAELERILKTSAETRKKAAWEKAKQLGIPTAGDTPGGGRFELQDFEDGKPVYHQSTNINAAISTAADKVRYTDPMFYVDGSGDTIGLWEVGGIPWVTHQEFNVFVTSRVVPASGQNLTFAVHATHVAGTLIGSGITMVDAVPHALRGMAPAAGISAYDSTNDLGEMALAGATQPFLAGKLMVSNHSYGNRLGWEQDQAGRYIWWGNYIFNATNADDIEPLFGAYDSTCVSVDGILMNAPYYLPFYSAGNDRNDGPPAAGGLWYWRGTTATPGNYVPGRDPIADAAFKGGYDTLSGLAACAKNVLTVGAVKDAVNSGLRNTGFAGMTAFSSWGPTDDGRIKPDIVANGQDVLSATYSNTTLDASAVLSGTSMASPNACGSALLLQQIYNNQFGEHMRADMLKCLIIHTTDDLFNPGPDYTSGWGLMNTRRAADVIEGAVNAQMYTGQLSPGQDSEVYYGFLTAGQALRVTLCWTDPPGTADTTHDNRAPDLVNDLDVEVIGPTGILHLPYVMPYVGLWTDVALNANAIHGANHTDNVEQVYLPDSVPGLYTITVKKTGSLSGGAQNYALIVGAEPPPDIEVTPATVNFDCACCGATTEPVSVTIRNTGASQLKNISSSIEGPGAANFHILSLNWDTLNPGDSDTVRIQYQAPATGTSSATLRITSNDPDEGSITVPLTASPYATALTLNWSLPLALVPQPSIYESVTTNAGSEKIALATTGTYDVDFLGAPNLYGTSVTQLAVYGHDSSGAPERKWLKSFNSGAGRGVYETHLASDAAGNSVFVQQVFSGQSAWSTSLRSYSAATGDLQWQVNDPDVNESSAYWHPIGSDVTVDNQGAVIAGRTNYDVRPTRLRLTKYSPAGGQLWNVTLDNAGIGTSSGNGNLVKHRPPFIAVDSSDNVIVCGQVELPSGQSYLPRRIYVGKFAAATGAVLWSKTFTGPGGEEATPFGGLAVGESGDIAIGGSFITTAPTGVGVLVAKLDGATGNILWSSSAPNITPMRVAMDERGDVIMAGTKQDSALAFHGLMFTRKYAGAIGATLWQQESAPIEGFTTAAYDLELDVAGHAIVSGFSESYAAPYKRIYRFKKYAAQTGNLLWEGCHDHADATGLTYTPSSFALRVNGSYKLYVAAVPGSLLQYELPLGNQMPDVVINHPSVTVAEGGSATANGLFLEHDGDAVAFSAIRNGTPFGTVTKNDAAHTWAWSLNTTDGPDQSGNVTITADDGITLPTTKTFTLTVNNVAPAFSAGGDVTLTPAEAITFARNITFTDPGTDIWSATVNYGDGGGNQPVAVDQAQKSLTLSHPFVGTGPWTVSVTINDGDPGGSTTHSFVVSIGSARTLNDWRMTHFGTTQNTGDAADLADPAKDGIPNLLKFAFDLDPHQNTPLSSLPSPSFSGGGGNFSALTGKGESNLGPGSSYTYSFTEPPGTTGIIYGAEYSANLTTWLPISDTGTGGTHTFSVPVGTNTKLFMRLKITTAP